jgi:hypothetical protein
MRRWEGSTYGLVFLVTAALAGCGDEQPLQNRKPVFPTAGQFLVNGAPAEGAMITFHPQNSTGPGRAIPSQARADAEGKFALTTYAREDGAPEGEYIVTVYWPAARPPAAEHDEDDSESTLPPDRLGGRLAAPGVSPLRASIKPNPTTFAPLDVSQAVSGSAAEISLTPQ